jgi:hypothetical protein
MSGMNSFLADARILLLRYTFQKGSERLDPLFAPPVRARLACPMISAAEFVAEANRMRRGRRLSPITFSGAMLQFRLDLMQVADIAKLPVDNAAIERAFALLEAHPLKVIDGIVLSLALDVARSRRAVGDELVLVTTDRTLLRAARREGLQTFNPAAQSDTELAALIGP